MKQENGKLEFVKNPEAETKEYIFQKNKKTKLGANIIVVFLGLLVIAVIVSALFFNTPEI